MPNQETKIFQQTNNTDEKINRLQKSYDYLYAKYVELNDKSEEIELGIMDKHIRANTITADKINVTSLSAITANLGTVTAGTISGTRLNIGAGTDEDIYFEDSEIRLYDYLSEAGAGYRGIAWKYSTEKFAHLFFHPTDDHVALHFAPSPTTSGTLNVTEGSLWLNKQTATNEISLYLNPSGGTNSFYMYGTGQLRLPALDANPTANLATGQLAIVNNVLRIYNGSAWANV